MIETEITNREELVELSYQLMWQYREIEVDYLDQDFKKQHGKYSGFTAQIIQHEIQHFSGELI